LRRKLVQPTRRKPRNPSPRTLPDRPAQWLAFNKPATLLTTRRDPQGRPTVYDRLPSEYSVLEAVGRLDAATTGLLLFTDDGRASQALLNPCHEIPRVYQVVTDQPLPPAALAALKQGVFLGDGTFCQPVQVAPLPGPAPGRSYRLTLQEGKNREVRRLVQHFQRRVRGLHRLQFGPVSLSGLRSGAVRLLTPGEVRRLYRELRRAGWRSPRTPGTVRQPDTGRAPGSLKSAAGTAEPNSAGRHERGKRENVS